jgi:small-conductance mechanosensitive channel
MSLSPSPSTELPAHWAAVLAHIEQSLAEAIAAVPQPLPEEPAAAAPEQPADAAMQQLRARLASLERCAAGALEQATEIDTGLATEAAALAHWLDGVEETRRQLAKATAPAVS